MKTPLLPTLVLSLAALASGVAMAAAPIKTVGGMLVNTAGMTLYTFDNDTAGSGKSACNGPCATNWPPLMATAEDQAMGDWSVITRDDGTKQWAYKGQPLYTWKNDMKPGDVTGDGVANGAWKVAQP